MKKTPLRRGTSQLKRSGFKKKPFTPYPPSRGHGGIERVVKPRKTHPGAFRRKKKSEQTKVKDALWQVTRLLVFKTYGSDCFTCNKKNLTGVNRHGGHVPWPRSILSTPARYDIRFIRAQCYDCNINKGGMGGMALLNMTTGGIDVKAMWEYHLETKGKVYPLQWFRDKTDEYKKLLDPDTRTGEYGIEI